MSTAGGRAIPPTPTPLSWGGRATPLAYRPALIGGLTAVAGAAMLVLAYLSGRFAEPPIYHDTLAGYDPPFDAIAGLLLLAIAVRIRDRSPTAWLFSLIAPALAISIAVLSPNVFSLVAAGLSALVVAFIYPYRVGFYRGSGSGPEATQLLILVSALLTLLFGMTGSRLLANGFRPAIGGWSDSLYFTVATISTNGSNYTPITGSARLFTVLLILFGVGTFLTAVVVLFVPFLERRLLSLTAHLERSQMEDLRDHVIICGTSEEARACADVLRGQGVRSLLISTDSARVEVLRTAGYRTYLGDPSSEEVMNLVGLARARALIAAGDSDAENLLTVITARGLEPQLRIVALARQDPALAKLRKAGANEAINLASVAARLVSAAALGAGDFAH